MKRTRYGEMNQLDMYKCTCGKSFRLKITYRKHKKGCYNNILEEEKNESVSKL